MIRAVTFDVWGTLLGWTPKLSEYWGTIRKKRMLRMLKALGRDCSMNDISKAYNMLDRKIRGDESLQRTDLTSSPRRRFRSLREMTVSDQVKYLLRLLDVEKIKNSWFAELTKVYAEAPLRKLPPCAKNARECLSHLKDEDIKIGIISNAIRAPGRVLRIILAKHEILEYFESTSFSDEVGVRKPHTKIFLHALSQLEVEPGDAVHVGDRLRDDVYGAKRVGMRAVLCRSTAPYLSDEEILKPDASIDELAQLPAILKSLPVA
jgi:HAD superfamily hydrolase (TIGR01662 family)